MTNEPRWASLACGPCLGVSTAFRAERRPGEAILIRPEDRRPMPGGGVRVLLLGQSVPSLMIQGFLFGDLPAVARLDPAADAEAALAALVRRPDRYDLVLMVESAGAADAIAFAETLSCRLGAEGARRGPFVVALDHELTPEAQARFRESGACAASLLLPLSHAGFTALLDGLFHG